VQRSQGIHDDDFMGTAFAGPVLHKSDVTPVDGSGHPMFHGCKVKEAEGRVFGGSAVVLGRIGGGAPSKPDDFRYTLVFVKHDDAWQMAPHTCREKANDRSQLEVRSLRCRGREVDRHGTIPVP